MDWLADKGIALGSALVAVVSLIIGICALCKAGKANDYADRAEQRETENNHVSFDYKANFSSSTITILNTGAGKILDLHGTISVDDVPEPVTSANFNDRDEITLHFPSLRAGHQEHLKNLRNQANAPYGSLLLTPDYFTVTWDLVWHSPLGNPEKSTEHKMVQFPDE